MKLSSSRRIFLTVVSLLATSLSVYAFAAEAAPPNDSEVTGAQAVSSLAIDFHGIPVTVNARSYDLEVGFVLADKLHAEELPTVTQSQISCLNQRLENLEEALQEPGLLQDLKDLDVGRIDLVLNSIDRISGHGSLTYSSDKRDNDAEELLTPLIGGSLEVPAAPETISDFVLRAADEASGKRFTSTLLLDVEYAKGFAAAYASRAAVNVWIENPQWDDDSGLCYFTSPAAEIHRRAEALRAAQASRSGK